MPLHHAFRSNLRAAGSVLACLLVGMTADAQVNIETYRKLNNDLANNAVSAVEVFSAGKAVSAGSFTYDNATSPDVEFSTLKLPLSHSFGASSNSVRPFLEGYLGYFSLKQGLSLSNPEWGSLKVRSGTLTAGGGVEWDANEWLTCAPRMQFAYSHVRLRLDGTPPPPLDALIESWNADALTVLPSLELTAHRSWGRWDVALRSHYTYLRVLGIHDTSPYIDLDSETHVWRNELSGRFHSPWKTLGLPLDFGALFARHDVAGQIRQSDFVEHFYEIRATIFGKLPEKFHPVAEVSLSGAYYFTGPLTGYSIGLSLGF